ncbi:MAG: hypothetical protein OXC26_14145 [Albidovulum sp.]|nr:hypothetical protein [Albidovulum sp.]
MEPEWALKLILAAIATRRFTRHAAGISSGDFPIAMLNSEIAERIETKGLIVRLFTATANEKARRNRMGTPFCRKPMGERRSISIRAKNH